MNPPGDPSAPLKILTWNIWMMPWWTFQSPRNNARAKAIAAEVLKRSFDIICFEKAFTHEARSILGGLLGATYPNQYGPVNKSGSACTLNGGVWVLSRLPLSNYHEIKFSDSHGIESFARKGAILLSGDLQGRKFHLLATHLQGSPFDPDMQAIRSLQMNQIAIELVSPLADPAVPLFLCGDFSTPRRDTANPSLESTGYQSMLSTFGAANGPDDRITLNDDRRVNDLADENTGRTAEVDYILLRRGSTPVTGSWERLIFQSTSWEPGGRKDLSYRYAVSASFTFE